MRVDLDLRKVRYFVAVAELLHFGRAAERLHIAQPVLSRQIRALEDELRTPLFLRDKRGTELTPAGVQLLAEARPVLAAAEALQRRVAVAARGAAVFTVGFMPGLTVTAEVRAFGAAHPDLDIDVVRLGWDDQTAAIRDGRVDVAYLRLPVDRQGLRLLPLFDEPRAVVLPAGHRLAGKERVDIADLADEHLLQDPDVVPEWRDIATELRGPGRPWIPPVRTVEEKFEHVAAGRGISIMPLSAATFYSRPDVTHAAVTDIGPSEVALGWDVTRRSALIDEFAAIAAARCGGR